MSEDDEPEFLKASDPSTWAKPEDVSWGDWMLKPGKPLMPRHRLLAEMLAKGCTTNEIAEKLNYTVGRVSVLASNSRIKDEVLKFQERMYDIDLEARMKALGPDAIAVVDEIINDPKIESLKKESAAKWLLEKLTGKAAQQIDIKGEISVGVFLDQLDRLQAAGKVINVTPESKQPGESPQETIQLDALELWVKENL